MTLFWHPTGPMLKYVDGSLCIADLNPETALRWRMSRLEIFWLGWRCIAAALWRA
jgi:hypothetical protein